MTIQECFNNRIGVNGCGAPASAAVEANPDADPPVEAEDALPVLFINSLPGITLENMDAIADDEQETFLGVWNDVVLRTMKKFEILAKAQLNKCYKLTDKTVVACLLCENKELFDVALWYLHGCELMIERTSTDVLNRFTTIDLEKAEKLKEEFYAEFAAALQDAVSAINPQESDCIEDGCVECNDTVKWAYQTP